MRIPLALLAFTLLIHHLSAKPEGIYHAESTFHRSSASYRNNELQHQNEDDGFYSEDGDLERKTKPKVNSYNQHSEYVNPKLRNGEYSSNNNQGIDSGLFANSDSQYAGASHYRAGAAASYGHAANLEELTQRIQADLSRQLQSAVSEQSSAYSEYSSSQMRQNLRRFEEELRANLTRKLQEALFETYGQQSVRGPYSYSITRNGDTSRTANYNVEDLENLKRQLENNLVNQLQQEVRTKYEASESRSYSSNNYDGGSRYRPVALTADSQVAGGVKTARRPTTLYYPATNRYPSADDQTGEFSETTNYGSNSNTNFATSSSSSTYRLTDIVHDVQLDLSRVIDELLAEEQRKNTELIQSGIRPNYDQNFQFLRQALIRNISDQIDEKINRYYGRQIERGDEFYSVTASGVTKNQPNYSREYLETLKQQAEDNLVEKLSYGIRQQASRYDEERPRNRPVNYGFTNSNSHSTSTFQSASQYGGVSGVAPLNSNTRPNYYNNNPDSEVELTNIQQQLQNDLSRQLQYAIREQTKEYNTYGTRTNVGSSSYQTALQQLTDELKRNLTEQLQRTVANQRSAYAYSSSTYNQQQLEDVSRHLQENLLRQLQDGLRQSWSSQYSYSASSSYNTRPTSYSSGGGGVKGGHAQSYTQYGGLAAAEDCDESGYSGGHYRGKREIVLRNRGGANDLTQQLEDFGYYNQQDHDLGQQFGSYEDLMQQAEDNFYNPIEEENLWRRSTTEANLFQQQQFETDDGLRRRRPQSADLTQQQQQTEDIYGFSAFVPRGSSTRRPGGYLQRNPNTEDLTQQQETEDIYGNLGLGSSRTTRRPGGYLQRNPDAEDLMQQQQQQQQTEDIYGNPFLDSTGKPKKYQQFGDGLTQQQQTEDVYGNFELGSRRTTQKPRGYLRRNPDAEDLTQQQETEDVFVRKPEAADLTQQQQETEDIYGNLGFASRGTTRQPGGYLQRNPDAEDLTQQQETEDIYANLGLSTRTTRPPRSFVQSNPDAEDLTQQQETQDIYGNLGLSSRRTTRRPGSYLQRNPDAEDLTQQQQQTEDIFAHQRESADLTQQQETEDIYGNLGFASRGTTKRPAGYLRANPGAEDLTQQQPEHIYGLASRTSTRKPGGYLQRNPNAEDLTQQQETEDIYGNLQLGSRTTEKPAYYQQQQPVDNLFQRRPPTSDDLTQQQQTEDLHLFSKSSTTPRSILYQQQFEDIYGALGLASSTKKPHSDDLTQQQEEEDVYGNFELASGRSQYRSTTNKYNQKVGEEEQPQGVVPLSASQTNSMQQTEDLTQQLEENGFDGLNQEQEVVEPIGRQDGSPSYYPPAAPHAQYTDNSSEDLVQKPIEKQTVYELDDVSSEADVRGPFDGQNQQTETQPQPGFWKRVGNKFSRAYGSVRDKAREVFG